MMLLVALLEPLQDAHGLFDGRFLQRDLLEATRQRAVLLDLLELVEGRRSHDAQSAAGEHGLEQRRQVHRAARGGAGADDAVQFVDEQDRVLALAERGQDGLEPLFEVAAEPRAGQQRRRVEREDLGAGKRRGHVALQQALREPFGHGGLAHAGIADKHRPVLPAPAQHFERALQFLLPPDQRVEQACRGALRQVDAVGGERVACHRRRVVVAGGHRRPSRRRPAGPASGSGTLRMPWEM